MIQQLKQYFPNEQWTEFQVKALFKTFIVIAALSIILADYSK